MKQMKKRSRAFLAALCLGGLIAVPLPSVAETAAPTAVSAAAGTDGESVAAWPVAAAQPAATAKEITLTAADATALTAARVASSYEGSRRAVVIGETGSTVDYTFRADAGDYTLWVRYYPVQTNNSATINRTLTVNGDTAHAVNVGFARRWVNDVTTPGRFDEDSLGNQIRPLLRQEPAWMETELYDAEGSEVLPIRVTLRDGENHLRLYGEDDSLAVETLRLVPYTPLKTYREIQADYAAKGYREATQTLNVYEAEHPAYQSDSTLQPTYERSSASVTPHDAFLQQVNMIGGSGWSQVGQYIVWQCHVEQSGLYALNFKYRKNVSRGLTTYRRLYIDGKVPFAEANSLRFAYTGRWTNYTPGEDGEPYLFYLEQGDHTLKLEANLGEMTGILNRLSDLIYEMNAIYRRIIVVTGPAPDLYRDYGFAEILPDVVTDIGTARETLQSIYDDWFALVGEKGQTFSTLDLMLNVLQKMTDDPEQIAACLNMFKSYIGSMGTLLNSARTGPLELDTVTVLSPDREPEKAECGFFEQAWFSLVHTFSSYVTDYDRIGTLESNADLREVRVWVTTGRDQYELLKNMTNSGDLEKRGVKANLQLVSASLLQAIVAGTAPDVQLTVGSSDLINYALRGAIVDVSKFDDFEEVSHRFYGETLVPLQLEGKTYGLPVTMNYSVLFYRTDILKSLNLSVPQTWDDVTRLITVLNKNNLEFGLPSDNGIFYTFLMQGGGQVYRDGGSRVAFDDQAGINAFIKWTRYFTDYGQPLSYDAQNRFRSGEMPLLIADYSLYNTLAVAAPEINGLWGFAPLPGTRQADGSLRRTAAVGSSATAIINGCRDEEAAWNFVKWWTEADVQANFGRGQESILGSSSRYGTANLEAMNNLPWTAAQKRVLIQQLQETKAVPEMPGGYLTARELTYAFYKVVNQEADPKDTLLEYVIVINHELTAKREEFGLKTAQKP